MASRRDKAVRMAHWDSHIPEPLVPARQLKVGDVILYCGHSATIDATRRDKGNVVAAAHTPGAANGFAVGFELVVPKDHLVRVVRFNGETD